MKTKAMHILLVLSSLSLFSCGGDSGSGSGSNVSVSAKVGTDYAVAYHPTFMDKIFAVLVGKSAMALSSGSTVDQVVAIPMNKSTPYLGGTQVETIANDGSFTLKLEKSYDWVILLINSQATTPGEKIVSYVAAGVNSDDTLIAYTNMSSNMDLGVLANANDEAVGQSNAASFNLTLEELTAVAQSDGSFKNVINDYLNYDQTTGVFHTVGPDFNWNAGSYALLGNKAPAGSDVSAYTFDGLSIGVETNNIDSLNLPDDVCTGATEIGLFPPSAITTRGGGAYDASTGVVNDGSGFDTNIAPAGTTNWIQDGQYYCYDNDFGFQYADSWLAASFGFGQNYQVPAGGLPEGQWLMKQDGVTIAEFDLAVSSPLDASGNILALVPAIRINYQASTGLIDAIDVSWFKYDAATGQYAELSASDINAVSNLIAYTYMGVTDENGPDINSPVTTHIVEAEYTYDALITSLDMSSRPEQGYFKGSAGDVTGNLVPTNIVIGYNSAGIGYRFVWSDI